MKRIANLFLMFLFFTVSCTPVAQVPPVPDLENPTLTPVFFPNPTITMTPLPVATATPGSTPTIVPTFNPIRKTPPTLMLHRPNLRFDSLAFLKEFVRILQQNDMHVVTYQEISKHPEMTATEQGKLFIITIDDISLAYPMTHDVLEMIDVLQGAGYPAVLGVVTQTDYPSPKNVERLRKLSELGWEIASHTDTHANLGKLEKASAKLVYDEVSISLDKIEKSIGIRPITLVLPEGQMVDYRETLDNMDLHWVVGINGGVTYDSQDEIMYVGREGPAKNAEYTYKIMKMRFDF